MLGQNAGKKWIRLPAMGTLAGFMLALVASIALAGDRTVVLGYICASRESARQVALKGSWERPGTLPPDCRSLLRRGREERLATLLEILEVVPVGEGRWAELGKVRRSTVETGYSAGVANRLLLF